MARAKRRSKGGRAGGSRGGPGFLLDPYGHRRPPGVPGVGDVFLATLRADRGLAEAREIARRALRESGMSEREVDAALGPPPRGGAAVAFLAGGLAAVVRVVLLVVLNVAWFGLLLWALAAFLAG